MKVTSIEFELPPDYTDKIPKCKTCINHQDIQHGDMVLRWCYLVERYVNLEDDYCSWHEEDILDEVEEVEK